MILRIEHDLMVSGQDLQTCSRRVQRFFERSQLVQYDSISVDLPHSINGADPRFEELLNRAIDQNRAVLADLLATVKKEGCREIDDLLHLPQGFQSKLLHVMSHLLDGFFGVDSRFFDIDEISNWVTASRRKKIRESPEECWLIRVKAESVYGGGFEKKNR
jgi:hypothetical protein